MHRAILEGIPLSVPNKGKEEFPPHSPWKLISVTH